MGGEPNDSLLHLAVRTIQGVPLFVSPRDPSSADLTTDTLPPEYGELVVQAQAPPVFAQPALADGLLVLSGSGPTNETYYVLSSTNLSQPLPEWTRSATNRFGNNGAFSFTNPVTAGERRRFYLLELP